MNVGKSRDRIGEPTRWVGDDPTESTSSTRQPRIRQAVVIVHGMGSQRPVDTLTGFVDTAIPKVGEQRIYYSRPAQITGSYEARRFIAPQTRGAQPAQRHVELFEYHWSYMMTGNRFGDVVSTTLRLLIRPPSAVPDGLFGIWCCIHLIGSAVAALAVAAGVLACRGVWPLAGWLVGIAAAVIGILAVVLFVLRGVISATFVDVVRYLDTSPRSYAARRAIRGGLVDLLHELHSSEYDRIVVVAHSLGGYISYDALSSLWADMHETHAGAPERPAGEVVGLDGLHDTEAAAASLFDESDSSRKIDTSESSDPRCSERDCREEPAGKAHRELVDAYQSAQYALWKGLRAQGNPWRVTDFVTVGTPMYFADILLTRPPVCATVRALVSKRFTAGTARHLFDSMVRRGQLVTCPPRSETWTVESNSTADPSYGWDNGPREVLGSQSLFAVTRWTNLWFPTRRGRLAGDWFGGRLAPLFGPGVRDIRVCGNRRWRRAWALAHSRYFAHPEDIESADLAGQLRELLNFKDAVHDLQDVARTAPRPDPTTTNPAVQRPFTSESSSPS